MTTFSTYKIFLVLACLFLGVYFAHRLSSEVPRPYDDSREYFHVADELSQGHLSILWKQNRSPIFPLLLMTYQKLHIPPQQGALGLNLLSALLALFFLPSMLGILFCSSALLLLSTVLIHTYENTLLTESILPSIVVVAAILSTRARESFKSRLWNNWAALLIAQFLILAFYKPAFKAFILFEFFWAFVILRKYVQKERALVYSTLSILLVVFTVNFGLLRKTGGKDLQSNKMVVLVYEYMPSLSDEDLSRMDPALAGMYRMLLPCSVAKPWSCGIDPDLKVAAQLYDYLFIRHIPEFIWSHTKKMFRLFRYSSWNINYGHLKRPIGLNHGLSFPGILTLTFILGSAMYFLSRKRKQRAHQIRFENSQIRLSLDVLSCFFVYGFLLQFFFCGADQSRYSLPWFIPMFLALPLCWFLVWNFLLSKPRR